MKPGGNVTSESGTSCSSGIKCHTVEAAEESQLEVDATLLLSLHHQEMSFKATTNDFIKNQNASKILIPNEDSSEQLEILTIVKIKPKRLFKRQQYKALKLTLPQLVGEKYEPVNEDIEWVTDFKASAETGICVNVKGGDEAVAKGEVSANMDVTDAMVKSVNIRKKTADLEVIRETFRGKEPDKHTLKSLDLKPKERLAFIHKRAYNVSELKLTRVGRWGGGVNAAHQSVAKLSCLGSVEENIEFTLPENSAFAYGLVEIVLEDGKIDLRSLNLNTGTVSVRLRIRIRISFIRQVKPDLLMPSDETWGLDSEVLMLVLVLTVPALQKLQL